MKPASNRQCQGAGQGRAAFRFAVVMIVLLALLSSPALPAQQPASAPAASPAALLTIASPAAMAVVHPGETLSIEVAVAPGAAFQFVTMVGEESFGMSPPLRQAPFRFPISVPENLSSGPHYFTAMGRMASGDMTVSLPLAVDVENERPPVSLKIDPQGIDLDALGEEIPIRVLAGFADGVETGMTRSSLLHFASSSPAVATVSSQGMVRAMAPGAARIVATFQSPTGVLKNEISVTVHEFAVHLSANSVEFGRQSVEMENATRVLTLTNPGDAPLQIREVQASGDYRAGGNCVSGGPLPPGGSCAIAVTFEPSVAGTRPGSVTIADSAVSAATVVPLSGTGVAR